MRCKNEILIMQLLQISYDLYNHWGLGFFLGKCCIKQLASSTPWGGAYISMAD